MSSLERPEAGRHSVNEKHEVNIYKEEKACFVLCKGHNGGAQKTCLVKKKFIYPEMEAPLPLLLSKYLSFC